jgi:YVTN family beta-propeller protein
MSATRFGPRGRGTPRSWVRPKGGFIVSGKPVDRWALGGSSTTSVIVAVLILAAYFSVTVGAFHPAHSALPFGSLSARGRSAEPPTFASKSALADYPARAGSENLDSAGWLPNTTTFTLDPYNSSLLDGVYDPPFPGAISGGTDLPSLGESIVGDDAGDYAYLINATTGSETGAIFFNNTHANGLYGSDPDIFAFGEANGLIYVGAQGDGSVSYVNAVTGSIVHVLTGFVGPEGLDYDSSNNYLYVSDWYSVVVLNGSTGETVDTIPVHAGIWPICLNSYSNSLLVADTLNSTVYVINVTTGSVVSNFSTVSGGSGYYPEALLYESSTQQIFSADFGDGFVSVIDATTNKLNVSTPEIDVGGEPASLAENPLRHEIDVSSCGASGLNTCLIYERNDTVAAQSLPSSNLGVVVFDTGSENLIIVSSNSIGIVFSGLTDNEKSTFALITGYLGGVFDPENGLEYVATPEFGNDCNAPGTLTVLDPTSHPGFLSSIPVADGPSEIAYDSTDQRLFVTDYCSDSVSVVNATDDSVVRLAIPVGESPFGVAWDPSSDCVYVANQHSQNITVINGSSLAPVATISLGTVDPYELSIDSNAAVIFISDIFNRSVTSINTTSNTIRDPSIPVGLDPQGLFYDSQDNVLYVADAGSKNVSTIDPVDGRELGNISVADSPVALALDPTDGLLFVADSSGGRISVINTTTGVAFQPSLEASGNPEGVVYVPPSRQVDVFDEGGGAINILADLPDVESVVVSPSPAEVGSSFSVSANVVGGTPPYTFDFAGASLGCSSANSSTISCVPPKNGSFGINVTATDSLGYAGQRSVEVEVFPRLGNATLTVAPGVVDLGGEVEFSIRTLSGTPHRNYSYVGLPPGCGSVSGPNLTCEPTIVGRYSVLGIVTDSANVSVAANVTLVVHTDPRIAYFVANPPDPVTNAVLSFISLVTGGTGPFADFYSGLPPGCVSSNAPELNCTPSGSGTFRVTFTATDSLGVSVSSSANVTVLPEPPPPEILGFFVSPAVTGLGAQVTFHISINDSENPYNLTWHSLPPGCAAPLPVDLNLTCTPSQAGVYSVGIWLNDSFGRSAFSSTLLQILASPVGGGGVSFWDSTAGFALLGLVALGVASIAVVVARHMKRKSDPADQTTQPSLVPSHISQGWPIIRSTHPT